MKEKSFGGSSRKAAMAAEMAAGVIAGGAADALFGVAAAVAGGRGGPKFGLRPGKPPNRPPERLSQPSTLSLKKSVRMIRFDVSPPWEWPTSQNALIFCRPIWSMMVLTMLCRYSSSASVQKRVGE